MGYNFTFLFQFRKMLRVGSKHHNSKFINDALRESFEPQTQTLKNIKAFADAYRNEKSKNLGNVEMMMN